MTRQRFYYAGGGGTAALTITARGSGAIKGARLTINHSAGAGTAGAELSTQGASQLTTSDARGILAKAWTDVITTTPGDSGYQAGCGEKCKVGDLLYLHVSAPGGGAAYIVEGFIDFAS